MDASTSEVVGGGQALPSGTQAPMGFIRPTQDRLNTDPEGDPRPEMRAVVLKAIWDSRCDLHNNTASTRAEAIALALLATVKSSLVYLHTKSSATAGRPRPGPALLLPRHSTPPPPVPPAAAAA